MESLEEGADRYIIQLGETFYQGMRKSLTISTYSKSIVLKHGYTFNFMLNLMKKNTKIVSNNVVPKKVTIAPTAVMPGRCDTKSKSRDNVHTHKQAQLISMLS